MYILFLTGFYFNKGLLDRLVKILHIETRGTVTDANVRQNIFWAKTDRKFSKCMTSKLQLRIFQGILYTHMIHWNVSNDDNDD